jgi:hypothetical protein
MTTRGCTFLLGISVVAGRVPAVVQADVTDARQL